MSATTGKKMGDAVTAVAVGAPKVDPVTQDWARVDEGARPASKSTTAPARARGAFGSGPLGRRKPTINLRTELGSSRGSRAEGSPAPELFERARDAPRSSMILLTVAGVT
jgi:hypothetical protein